jgi:hypothetical protein
VTSNINYLNINENFPVAGQDNDTQTFRDNFDSIKTSLRVAGEEITDLQNETVKLTSDNDFNLNKIQNAILENVRDQKLDARSDDEYLNWIANLLTVDFENGPYQIFRCKEVSSIDIDFLNFPGDIRNVPEEIIPIGLGKVTLELYKGTGTSGDTTVNFSLSGSGATTIKSLGFPGFTEGGIPTVTLTSSTDPVIIEIWRHRTEEFFMRYLGTFA